MQTLRVAAAQTVPVPGDVPRNVERHRRLVVRAAEEGVQLVVFPELSLTGYELERAESLAFATDDARLSPLEGLARRHGIVVVAGAPVRLPSGLHIGAFVLHPDRPARIYTKHHLHDGEERFFAPGTENPMVALGEDRGALAICADTSHPAHAAAAARAGATVYLAGVFFTPKGYPSDAARLAGYAEAHGMAVCMANLAGRSGGLDAAGGSAVWSSAGERLARLDGEGAGLAIATREEGGWRGESVR